VIKDIILILNTMHLACPVECSTRLYADHVGNLVLEWRWVYNNNVMKYSHRISQECGDVMPAIDLCIRKAKADMEHKINPGFNMRLGEGE
jgi:hypothetical protein